MHRRTTKVAHNLKCLNYEERCNALGLTTLVNRRIIGDLIQKYKFEKGVEDINWETPPLYVPARGGHKSHYIRELVRNNAQRHNFFNNRIANTWNKLPDDVVNASNVNAFKNRYDKLAKGYYSGSSTHDTFNQD